MEVMPSKGEAVKCIGNPLDLHSKDISKPSGNHSNQKAFLRSTWQAKKGGAATGASRQGLWRASKKRVTHVGLSPCGELEKRLMHMQIAQFNERSQFLNHRQGKRHWFLEALIVKLNQMDNHQRFFGNYNTREQLAVCWQIEGGGY